MSTEQVGKNISGKSSFDGFGSSVAISKDGSVICIGGYLGTNSEGNKKGYLRLYKNNHCRWVQVGRGIDRKDEIKADFLLNYAVRYFFNSSKTIFKMMRLYHD